MRAPDGMMGELLRAFEEAGVRVRRRARTALIPAQEMGVHDTDWRAAADVARGLKLRLASFWAEERGRSFLVTAILEKGGAYIALRTRTRRDSPCLPSIAPIYPAADRLERHARDLYGVDFEGHPDGRRWTRHQAWAATEFPLRSSFPVAGTASGATPADHGYPCAPAHGAGVYEIPVGPVHAGIIEPGHFRFQAVGEDILSLEERLGYVHKGIEKVAVGRDAGGLVRLAGRISGDSTVAHAWAACMAVERAVSRTPPPRALELRALLCERERVVNHLWDIAAVANDVAFTFAYFQLGRLVEDWRRLNAEAFGHRLLMDRIVPGGVAVDLDERTCARIVAQCAATRTAVAEIWQILQASSSLHDRLAGTGVLSADDAERLGAVGFVGRASGLDFDVRRDAPYAPYDALSLEAPCLPYGDVAARVRVRYEEVLVSIGLIERLAAALSPGEVHAEPPQPKADAEGLGIVDGWRGEIVTFVRYDVDGRIARFFPRDPSWLTWPALEHLIHGNIVPDFPVCNKSVNASYSGHDI